MEPGTRPITSVSMEGFSPGTLCRALGPVKKRIMRWNFRNGI